MLKSLTRFIPAPQAVSFVDAHCLTHRAVEYAQSGTSISALVKARQTKIVEKAGERIENLQKSVPQPVHIGQRNIEDKAERILANSEKLSSTLRVPPYQPYSS